MSCTVEEVTCNDNSILKIITLNNFDSIDNIDQLEKDLTKLYTEIANCNNNSITIQYNLAGVQCPVRLLPQVGVKVAFFLMKWDEIIVPKIKLTKVQVDMRSPIFQTLSYMLSFMPAKTPIEFTSVEVQAAPRT